MLSAEPSTRASEIPAGHPVKNINQIITYGPCITGSIFCEKGVKSVFYIADIRSEMVFNLRDEIAT